MNVTAIHHTHPRTRPRWTHRWPPRARRALPATISRPPSPATTPRVAADPLNSRRYTRWAPRSPLSTPRAGDRRAQSLAHRAGLRREPPSSQRPGGDENLLAPRGVRRRIVRRRILVAGPSRESAAKRVHDRRGPKHRANARRTKTTRTMCRASCLSAQAWRCATSGTRASRTGARPQRVTRAAARWTHPPSACARRRARSSGGAAVGHGVETAGEKAMPAFAARAPTREARRRAGYGAEAARGGAGGRTRPKERRAAGRRRREPVKTSTSRELV